MKKKFFAIVFSLLLSGLAACGSDSGGSEVKRNVTVFTADARWNHAADVSSDRYLYVYDKMYREAVSPVQRQGAVVDTLECTGLEATDAVLSTVLKNMLIDYRYQQVSLIFSGAEEPGGAEGAAALSKLADLVKEYAPLADFYFFNGNQERCRAFEMLKAKNGYASHIFDSSEVTAKLVENIDKPTREMNYKKHANATSDADIAEFCEDIEWTKTHIDWGTAAGGAKKILFIGDSISEGYGPIAREKLGENVALSYLRTSRGVGDKALFRELEVLLNAVEFDAIHFNIGLHKHRQNPTVYAQKMEYLIEYLRAKEKSATLLFSNTTPYSKLENGVYVYDEANSADVVTRNALMKKVCTEKNLPYLDLFAFVRENDPPKLDTVHYSDYIALGNRVAEFVLENLELL